MLFVLIAAMILPTHSFLHKVFALILLSSLEDAIAHLLHCTEALQYSPYPLMCESHGVEFPYVFPTARD